MSIITKSRIWVILLLLVPIVSAIEMEHEIFGFGGGEDVLAVEQHVGTYDSTYIGGFPIAVVEEEIPEEAVISDGTFYEEQQLKSFILNCTESGWRWNGTACIPPPVVQQIIKKQAKNIVPLIIAISYAAMVLYRRRKKRIRKRKEQMEKEKRERKLETLEITEGEEYGPSL